MILTPLAKTVAPLGVSRGSNPYLALINSLAPLYWRRFNETTGLVGTNYGSLGGTTTYALGAGAINRTGQLGDGEAFDFDGANTIDTFPNNASIANAQTFSVAFLTKLDSAGEGSIATAYCHGTLSADHCLRLSGASRALTMRVDYATNANSATNETLDTDKWYWVFGTYDVNGDRKAYLYRSLEGGAVSAFTYAAQIASVGAYSAPAGTFNVGAIGNNTGTWDGLIDEFMFFNYVLTTPQMQQIVDLS